MFFLVLFDNVEPWEQLSSAGYNRYFSERHSYFWQNYKYSMLEAGYYFSEKFPFAFATFNLKNKYVTSSFGLLSQSVEKGFLISSGAFYPEKSGLILERLIGLDLGLSGNVFTFDSAVRFKKVYQNKKWRLSGDYGALVKPGLKWKNFTGENQLRVGFWQTRDEKIKKYFPISFLQKNKYTDLFIEYIGRYGYLVYASAHYNSITFYLIRMRKSEINDYESILYNGRQVDIVELHYSDFNAKYRNRDKKEDFTLKWNKKKLHGYVRLLPKRSWISGGGYHNYEENVQPYVSFYKIDSENGFIFSAGISFGTRIKIAYAKMENRTDNYFPMDIFFWDNRLYDDNLRDDDMNYFNGVLEGFHYQILWNNWRCYGWFYQPKKQEWSNSIFANFRIGYQREFF